MEKYWEFTKEIKKYGSTTLRRIRLTIDCQWGVAGDLGGWIEKEDNLTDNAWVSGGAQVSGSARVSGGAWVYGDAQVSGSAQVSGDAQVSGSARVSGDAQVSGDARVYGDAQVSGDAWVYDDAQVSGDAWVYGDARVYGGEWATSPIQIKGSRHFVNECKPGYIQIGCQEFSIQEWLNNGEAVGKREKYSEAQLKEYKLYVELIQNINKLREE